jgi:hypothetical protein
VANREVRCGSCGALNRVAQHSIALLPKCGKCHATLAESRVTRGLRFLYRNRSWGPIAAILLCLGGYKAYSLLDSYLKLPAPEIKPSGQNVQPAAIEAPVPSCSMRPTNGQVIEGYRGTSRPGHVLTIDNGSTGNAIVKVRNAATGRVVVSFFVDANARASFNYLNDGSYRIQYVLGEDLADNCKAFIRPLAVKEFPGNEVLVTTRTQTEVIRQELTFTLYAVPSGTIVPRSIDLKEFDAE